MELQKVKSKDSVKTIQSFIFNQRHGIAYCVHDEKLIFTLKVEMVDETLCDKMGYKVLETYHNGGVVVVNKGDMSVVHFGELNNDFMVRFVSHSAEWLKEKGLNATFEGNDLLIDGYKIGGASQTQYSTIKSSVSYSTMHFGMNTNLDHIKAICKKPMQKVPKGLSEYGITTEEVEQMFLEFCEQYQQNY